MAIGNTSLSLDLLNGATTWVQDLSAGSAVELAINGAYTLQATTADGTFGFGITSAAAITDAASGRGEVLLQNASPRVIVVLSEATKFVSCAGSALRIRRVPAP